jgi:TetR/AcrR family transcriptional repressor of mexCD-oprJ operon
VHDISTRPAVNHRRSTADHNIAAICDAAERLLARGLDASISAVAADARLSRVTVYSHFPTRQKLLEAVLDRAIRAAAAAVEAAEPDAGSPFEALDRVVGVGWQHLERSAAMARATGELLPASSRRRLHGPAFAPIHRLVERGRREGAFRTDVPSDWLVACAYALIHAAADEVRAGRLNTRSAPKVLSVSMHDLFQGT